ncbi:MAG: hypothetical protein AAF702_40520 [Chloroflexota bacterium]
MSVSLSRLTLHQQATYRIYVQGTLGNQWADYFGGLAIAQTSTPTSGVTVLTGRLADQAALLGVLNHLYGLGLPLIGVEWLEKASTEE